MKKLSNMSKLIVTFTILLTFGATNLVNAQTPNGTLNFGTPADGTVANAANTGFNVVRLGSGGGGFTLLNPGQVIGTNGELRGLAPTTASVNSVGITSAGFGTPATAFTINFNVYFTGGDNGIWLFFVGNGAGFESNTGGFTGVESFTGLQFTYGTGTTITTANRAGGSFVNLTTTPFSKDIPYRVTVVGNNSAATVIYGNQSVDANTYDLFVNGVLVGDNLAKAQLPNGTAINAFRFYGRDSTANGAAIHLDNVSWFNQAVEAVATAASVSMNGRVVDSRGRGISRARVVLTDATTGITRYVQTKFDGRFAFDNIVAGHYVVIGAESKRHRFDNPQQGFQITGDEQDVTFTAQ